MTKRLKYNLLTWFIYSVIIYITLIPLKLWIISIGISMIVGWFAGILNDIVTQLRKLNGDIMNNSDKPDELIKS